MRRRGTWAAVLLVGGTLVLASLAGAASRPSTLYTFSAAPPAAVKPAGTMTVLLPAEWRVSTSWGPTALVEPRPNAEDPVHRSISWSVEAWLAKKGTTLAELRRTMLGWSGRPIWGKGTPINQKIGDVYLSLPIGKVWRYVTSVVPAKGEERTYMRVYVLDRGPVRQLAGGAERELFTRFWVYCAERQCRSHNRQLDAVMRSVRIAP